jgi:hypothetical protein
MMMTTSLHLRLLVVHKLEILGPLLAHPNPSLLKKPEQVKVQRRSVVEVVVEKHALAVVNSAHQ